MSSSFDDMAGKFIGRYPAAALFAGLGGRFVGGGLLFATGFYMLLHGVLPAAYALGGTVYSLWFSLVFPWVVLLAGAFILTGIFTRTVSAAGMALCFVWGGTVFAAKGGLFCFGLPVIPALVIVVVALDCCAAALFFGNIKATIDSWAKAE